MPGFASPASAAVRSFFFGGRWLDAPATEAALPPPSPICACANQPPLGPVPFACCCLLWDGVGRLLPGCSCAAAAAGLPFFSCAAVLPLPPLAAAPAVPPLLPAPSSSLLLPLLPLPSLLPLPMSRAQVPCWPPTPTPPLLLPLRSAACLPAPAALVPPAFAGRPCCLGAGGGKAALRLLGGGSLHTFPSLGAAQRSTASCSSASEADSFLSSSSASLPGVWPAGAEGADLGVCALLVGRLKAGEMGLLLVGLDSSSGPASKPLLGARHHQYWGALRFLSSMRNSYTCPHAFKKLLCLPLTKNPCSTPSLKHTMSDWPIHAISSVPKNMTGTASAVCLIFPSFFCAAPSFNTCAGQ
mmetsp:Transcript_10267/g.27990  ORF Transcript_10267/g.27990 Transcript_10267/m.27990 type:complete len:356 (-) Transcript_10267:273-1340(-)